MSDNDSAAFRSADDIVKALEQKARAIINKHAEYMHGLDRGQRNFGVEAVFAMVKEALASRPDGGQS